MAIIGRKEEIRALEKCEKSKKSELICVYGRRRVGKIIKGALRNRKTINTHFLGFIM